MLTGNIIAAGNQVANITAEETPSRLGVNSVTNTAETIKLTPQDESCFTRSVVDKYNEFFIRKYGGQYCSLSATEAGNVLKAARGWGVEDIQSVRSIAFALHEELQIARMTLEQCLPEQIYLHCYQQEQDINLNDYTISNKKDVPAVIHNAHDMDIIRSKYGIQIASKKMFGSDLPHGGISCKASLNYDMKMVFREPTQTRIVMTLAEVFAAGGRIHYNDSFIFGSLLIELPQNHAVPFKIKAD